MKLKRIGTWILVLIGMAGTAMAQNPFVGTWKLNPAKSNLTGSTIKFDVAAANSMEISAEGTSYSFRINGKNFRMSSGDLAAWKQSDSSTWTTEYRRPDGKLIYTDTWKLSSDNRTLTVTSAGIQPNGEKFADTAVYIQTAGTTGLVGTWKNTETKLSTPNELTIASYGLGGLSINIAAEKATLLAPFDGTDVAPTGPNVPPGITYALFRIGPASFRMVRKIDGRVTFSSRFTLSADSSTLTEVGNSAGDPSQTLVWEKQ